MTSQDTTGYNAQEMAQVPAVIRGSVDQLAERAAVAPAGPDAGWSTPLAVAALLAVAESMRTLTREVTLIADNVTAAGSIYQGTDEAVREAIERTGGGGR